MSCDLGTRAASPQSLPFPRWRLPLLPRFLFLLSRPGWLRGSRPLALKCAVSTGHHRGAELTDCHLQSPWSRCWGHPTACGGAGTDVAPACPEGHRTQRGELGLLGCEPRSADGVQHLPGGGKMRPPPSDFPSQGPSLSLLVSGTLDLDTLTRTPAAVALPPPPRGGNFFKPSDHCFYPCCLLDRGLLNSQRFAGVCHALVQGACGPGAQ